MARHFQTALADSLAQLEANILELYEKDIAGRSSSSDAGEADVPVEGCVPSLAAPMPLHSGCTHHEDKDIIEGPVRDVDALTPVKRNPIVVFEGDGNACEALDPQNWDNEEQSYESDLSWSIDRSPLSRQTTTAVEVCQRWADFAIGVIKWQDMFVLRQCWQQDSARVTTSSAFASITVSHKVSQKLSSTSGDPVDIIHTLWLHAGKRATTSHMKVSMQGLGSAFVCMLHPNSWQRLIWVAWGMLFLFADIFLLTMTVFGVDRLLWLDFTTAIYWSCDILASFRTGVYTSDGLNMDPSTVARQFLRGWFWIDGFIAVYQWVMIFLDIGGEASSSAGVLRYIKIARHVKLIRLAKIDVMLRQLLQRIQSLWAVLVLKMSLYLIGVFAWVHLSATLWYAIGTMSENGWVSAETAFASMPVNYYASIHWAAAQLQGNVDIYPSLPIERAFASLHLISSVVVLALLVSKLTTVMHAIQEARAEKRRLLHAARYYLQLNHISPELSFNVKAYVQKKQAIESKHCHNGDEHELLRVLPADLRRALLQEARGPILKRHVLFVAIQRCNKRCFQRLCCDVLSSRTVLPDESIFCGGTLCCHYYAVVAGSTCYYGYTQVMSSLMCDSEEYFGRQSHSRQHPSSRHSHFSQGLGGAISDAEDMLERHRQSRSKHIEEGAHLCEPALWVRWVHRGDFDAVSQASLLFLEVPALEELITSYVAVQLPLQRHAARMLRNLSETVWLTDLYCTTDALRREDLLYG